MSHTEFAGFSRAATTFLKELAQNNNRDWFQANKDRYETAVIKPSMQFIEAMQPRLHRISPEYEAVAKRVGGSMFRIYRDVRFSKDKNPYKTHVAFRFGHRIGKKSTAPIFYMHFDPSQLFLGLGVWHPESAALNRIRGYLDTHQSEWVKARDSRAFRRHFELGGESLQRPPRGYSQDHPLLQDLKRKDHVGYCELPLKMIFQADIADQISKRFAEARPYMAFLSDALGVPF